MAATLRMPAVGASGVVQRTRTVVVCSAASHTPPPAAPQQVARRALLAAPALMAALQARQALGEW